MKKTQKLTISEYELPIVIEEDENKGFTARCSPWDDCYAEGETIEDVVCEISAVANSLIKLYQEKDMEIPLKIKREYQKEKTSFAFKFPLLIPAC